MKENLFRSLLRNRSQRARRVDKSSVRLPGQITLDASIVHGGGMEAAQYAQEEQETDMSQDGSETA